MHEKRQDVGKLVKDAYDLPQGPDTTENINEVVEDPEQMDVEAGWYARKEKTVWDEVAETLGAREVETKPAWVVKSGETPDVMWYFDPESQTFKPAEDQETKMLQEDYAFNYNSLLRKMQDTHARKNADYGDAAYKGYKKYGDYYFLVQLSNKLSRLESLTIGNKKQQVLDESIDDTLLDLANYAVMYLESRHRHD